MNSVEFLEESARTVPTDYEGIMGRMSTKRMVDLQHAGMGLQTETAEFTDALKKHIFYGKELDEVNLLEELGDALWYIALALRTLGSDFDIEMDKNIRKLMARFPDKFTEYDAEHRDLDKERKILEED